MLVRPPKLVAVALLLLLNSRKWVIGERNSFFLIYLPGCNISDLVKPKARKNLVLFHFVPVLEVIPDFQLVWKVWYRLILTFCFEFCIIIYSIIFDIFYIYKNIYNIRGFNGSNWNRISLYFWLGISKFILHFLPLTWSDRIWWRTFFTRHVPYLTHF